MKKTFGAFFVGLLLLVSHISLAGSSVQPLAKIEIFQDEETLKRGVMVYYNSCRLCHSMKYIRYQDLVEIGFSTAEIKKLRGRLTEKRLTSINSAVILTQIYGLVPPDLSLMAKARSQGPQYIYTLLTSYYEKSANIYDNKLFPGIRMPDIFSHSLALNPQEKTKTENKILDVTAFLVWASDPKAQERKSLGKYVIAYLVGLSIMFYFVMKRVWGRLE